MTRVVFFWAYLGMGDKEKAFEHYERGVFKTHSTS